MIASYSAMAAPLLRSCSRVVTDQLSYSTAPMLPLSVALRRWYHPNGLNRNHTTTTAAASARWLHCRARLYARYLLTLAAAQTASLNHRTRLEEGSMNQLTPLEWNDWSRKEWSAELLQRLGSNPVTRVWNATKRVLQLALLATPLLVVLPFSFYSQRLEQWSWSYALWGIEQAGPTFIKLTQWATTRQDLFSPEFCQYFGKLRDETIGHTWQETLEILQSAQEEFTHVVTMETTPIGSGCIAQVYRGTLLQACGQHPAGTEIAIKVQHPGIWHKVCVDFYLFDKLAGFLEGLPGFNLQYLSLRDTIRQFRDIMLPQLDLTLERNHLKRFLRDFSGDEQVSFPRPIDELTSTRVLTETFVHGRPIMEFTGPDTPQAVKVELANLGLNTTLKMMFVHDFLHGDLHPGNILIGRNDKNQLVMHLLDCGLVVEVGPEQHVNMIKILGAFTRRNGRVAGQLMVDTSRDCQAGPEDVELFVKGIELICFEDEGQNFIEKIGEYIADICYMACKHKVKLEASFINMALGIEIMEGIATALNPNIQVAKVALPMVLQAEVMHRLPKFNLW